MFFIIMSAGNSIFGLALVDFFFNPDASYMDAMESIVMFTHVRYVNLPIIKMKEVISDVVENWSHLFLFKGNTSTV